LANPTTAMLRLFLAGFIVALAETGAANAGPYEDGVDAYSRSDYATALMLWRPLAEHGNALAETQLGLMYFAGRGVSQDYAQALNWYRLAAGQGDANAEFYLGEMYFGGQGVPRDAAQAVRWYLLAANQGLVWAEGNLGYMYATGQGVERDYVQALVWFNLAAAGGDTTAVQNGQLAAAQLTPAELVEAEHLTRAWKPVR
jgi:TPR repeat protein